MMEERQASELIMSGCRLLLVCSKDLCCHVFSTVLVDFATDLLNSVCYVRVNHLNSIEN